MKKILSVFVLLVLFAATFAGCKQTTTSDTPPVVVPVEELIYSNVDLEFVRDVVNCPEGVDVPGISATLTGRIEQLPDLLRDSPNIYKGGFEQPLPDNENYGTLYALWVQDPAHWDGTEGSTIVSWKIYATVRETRVKYLLTNRVKNTDPRNPFPNCGEMVLFRLHKDRTITEN